MFEYVENKENEELSNHTTLRVGGRARWFLLPSNVGELKKIISDCQNENIKYFILGNGSNLLVSDHGYDGAIISMSRFNKIEKLNDEEIEVGGGVNLFSLNKYCAEIGLGGLEWSYGIPASVGGACRMNAGAYGGEFCKFIKKITIFNKKSVKNRKKIKFSYRNGCLNDEEILISVVLKLEKKKPEEIQSLQNYYLEKRKASQPYGEKSLGSVFKRGTIIPAKIIDEMGYKGLKLGGMEVSKKHAGFIVNGGVGSAQDFLNLVSLIENSAERKGYKFEREFIEI